MNKEKQSEKQEVRSPIATTAHGDGADAGREDAGGDEPSLDEAQLAMARERLRAQQNRLGGFLAGVAALVATAVIWAAITAATDYQIGWMAIGVGFVVGIAVRIAGKGIDPFFGILGAVLALVGCVLGNLLTGAYFVSEAEGTPLVETVLAFLVSPGAAFELLEVMFSPMDLLFYGFALSVGYKTSFREVTPELLVSLSEEGTGAGGETMAPGRAIGPG